MTVVLAYHRVAEPLLDPQLLSVSPVNFAEQLAALVEISTLVPLRDAIGGGHGDRRVVITFDDGYADNADVALPLLERAGAPATMFVTEGMVGRTKEFWWDELEVLLLSGPVATDHVELKIGAEQVWADVRDDDGRARLYVALVPRLRRLPSERIDEVLEALAETLRIPRAARPTHLPLDQGGLERLAASELTDVGAHSVSHSLLRPLPADRQYAEVRGSRIGLEDRIGRPVELFAYPFGGHDAFSRTTRTAVRRAGYRLACANLPGRVSRWSPRYALPRHLVRDWSGDELVAKVRIWFEA